ncbi:MAG: competence/damage-inducible protein A [Chloroflexi bacterium]|nr:competence/damage-inducible protein A [Chloroflexota bacterium]
MADHRWQTAEDTLPRRRGVAMRAEIISIGTEIMLGEITDTNASFIAGRLPQYGIDLLYVSQVGDNPGRMKEVLGRAWDRSDLIFTTGGLGPTEDDITREMIAEMLGEPMTRDPEQEEAIRARLSATARPMPERNLKQAAVIPSARILPNARGTAPGWWVERDNRVIVMMPGPPAEMHPMWEALVHPELERRSDSILVSRTLKTSGLGESAVDEMLSALLSSTNPSIGIYHRADGVHARIAAKARTFDEARALIAPMEAKAREILGFYVWGVDGESLGAAVGHMLREQGLSLGVMESASGGLLASAITDVDGASDYFRGSLVTYATEVKHLNGVLPEVTGQHGVISRETAEAMATAAREQLHADIGIGITGIAGSGEVEGQPPGTMHIALSHGDEVRYALSRYYQGREPTKRRTVLNALTLLRNYLMERAGAKLE